MAFSTTSRRCAPLLFLLAWAGCASAPRDAPSPGNATSPGDASTRASRLEVLVLGIAQDGGLPHVGCSQPCCMAARRDGRQLFPACLAIHDAASGKLCLVEATPRIEPQLALLHRLTGQRARGRQPVDAVMLTHAHIGHYLGLLQFGFEVAATKDLPVYVTPRFARFLRANGPWSQLVGMQQIIPREVAPGASFSPLPGVTVTSESVPHRDEFSDTVAFKIRGPDRTVLFVPDIDAWSDRPGLLERLIEDVDVAFLDATFYDGRELPGRDLSKVRHPFMIDTMRRLESQAKQAPGRFRFIHLNHTNPALHDPAVVEEIERRGFRLARQGERVGL
jgi:pyrroloquinoline quinone biosynthesis protein B